MIIYKITNNLNGKVYIGQTVRSLEERWKEHGSPNRVKSSAIGRAILKYGKKNFSIEEVLVPDTIQTQSQLNALERYFVQLYNSLVPNGYNLKEGGSAGASLSQESRLKISAALKGKPKSELHNRKNSAAHKGKRFSEEHKKNISMSKKGHWAGSTNPRFGNGLSGSDNPMFGKRRTEAEKSAVSEANRKPVEWVETGAIFKSMSHAAKYTGIGLWEISKTTRSGTVTRKGWSFRFVEKR